METSPGPNETSLHTETVNVGTNESDVSTDSMLIGADCE